MRGGVSTFSVTADTGRLSSPRAWGCFRPEDVHAFFPSVFPTCVGVFLCASVPGCSGCSLPHVRGGVSLVHPADEVVIKSSPRAWGCFPMTLRLCHGMTVFPTCVGVFPRQATGEGASSRLPHVRGGVSTREDYYRIRSLSSPRAWGCFLRP